MKNKFKPMKKLFLLTLFLIAFKGYAQSDFLAKQYLRDGSFEKASTLFEKLHQAQPQRWDYVSGYVEALQQLEAYDKVEDVLMKYLELPMSQPAAYIILGDNYIKKGEPERAMPNFDKALAFVAVNPNYIYNIAKYFENINQLDYAIAAYEESMKGNDKLNFDYQIAALYGQQGNSEEMFKKYLSIIQNNPPFLYRIQGNLNNFITEDSSSENNQLFRKLLLQKMQSQPDVLWNELLSWLFIQQKEYQKAMMQQKAIFNRTKENLSGVFELAGLAADEGEMEVAKDGYEFIIKNTFFAGEALEAQLRLLALDENNAAVTDLDIQKRYEALLTNYGRAPESVNLQLAYARFMAFRKKDPDFANKFLKTTLQLGLNDFQTGAVKMLLADILVYQGKFNEAILTYNQIAALLKNDVVAQEARFKSAKANYFKGDFEWAQTQLKVLKSSHTQLIANDALELSWLISENILNDSLHTSLKKFAEADWFDFKNETPQAIAVLENFIGETKGDMLTDDALYKLAQFHEKLKNYEAAENYFLAYIKRYPYDLWIDESYFYLAKLYIQRLNKPESAKELLEKLIFEHPDSIHVVEATRMYRVLRGENIG